LGRLGCPNFVSAAPNGRRDYSPQPSLDLSQEFLPPKRTRPKIKSTKAKRPKKEAREIQGETEVPTSEN
jgi:hypothetical protein